jgi:MFS transporter, putative metabolite:H+ symporter
MGIMVGFFGPLSITLVAETTPKEFRGRYMSLIQISISIGQLYGLLVGYFTLDSLSEGNWRMLIFWTTFPGLIAFLGTLFWVLESPMYLLNQLDIEKTVLVLNEMNDRNGRQIFDKVEGRTKDGLLEWVLNTQAK